MNDRCPTDDELVSSEALEPGDPVVLHLQGCARCRARLRAYREFMAEPPAPATAGERAARAELSAALERAIAGDPRAQRRAGDPDAGRSWWRRAVLGSPASVLRPALAVAALGLIAFGGVQIASRMGEDGPSGLLRGGDDGAAAGMTLSHCADEGGAVVLTWSRVPAADAYEVVLYGAALDELGRIPAGTDTALALLPVRLPAAAARETVLVCRAVASRGGDEIVRSNLLPVARSR